MTIWKSGNKRRQVIRRLKKLAKYHYKKSLIPDHLDCGRQMADLLRGTNTFEHAQQFDRCIQRLRRIDPELRSL